MIELLILWVIVSVCIYAGRAIADIHRGGPYLSDPCKKGRIKTNLNAVALALNIYDYLKTVDYHKLLTPKTPIQKEIEEKRKEIEKLQEHIKDMAELNSLEQKEKELFRKIADEDLKSRGIDTKTTTELYFKWCEVCGNAYTGGSCDCFDKRNDGFVWVPVSKDEMRLKRATYKMKDPLATHVEECPYCSAYSFEYEYVKDGMIQTCRNCETEVGMIKVNSPIKETMK